MHKKQSMMGLNVFTKWVSDESLHDQNMQPQNRFKKKSALLNIILILLSTFATLKWGTMNKMAH